MKKKYLLVCLIFFLIVGILSGKIQDKEVQEYDARFILIAPKIQTGISQGTKAADKEFHTNTKYIIPAHLDESAQAEVFEYAILTNIDGIITSGLKKSEKIEQMIKKAQQNGIPVIFIDSDQEESSRNCYIGSNNVEIGKLAGEAVVEATDEKSNICVIVSEQDNSNQKERMQGFQEIIEPYSHIVITSIVECKSNAMLIREKVPAILKEHPEINTIVCAEGASVNCCADVLKDSGFSLDKYKIICMDYFTSIKTLLEDGSYYAAILQNPYQMGYQAVQYLRDIYDGKVRTETQIYIESHLLKNGDTPVESETEEEEVDWYVY